MFDFQNLLLARDHLNIQSQDIIYVSQDTKSVLEVKFIVVNTLLDIIAACDLKDILNIGHLKVDVGKEHFANSINRILNINFSENCLCIVNK